MKIKLSLLGIIFVCLAQTLFGQDSLSIQDRRLLKHERDTVATGIASFYDNKFVGRRTSNGEIFSQKKLTAASNRLPLNTYAKVTSLSNGHAVIVKITDRMHPKNKRLIDLSRSAASKLLFTGRGLTKVKVEYLGKNPPPAQKVE